MDTRSARSRTNDIFRLVLWVLGGQVLLLYAVHHYADGARSIFWGPYFHGLDFECFYSGAKAWLAGQNPYKVSGFVTPPVSLVIPALLTGFRLDQATAIFIIGNLVILVVTLWWYLSALGLETRERVLFLLAATLFLPAQTCIRGGNMDAIMLVLLMVACSFRSGVMGAVAFAASIAVKLYSIILLPVVVRRRQWRYAMSSLAALCVLLLPFHAILPSAFNALFLRGSRYSYGTISPASIVYTLGGTSRGTYTRIGLAFWLVTYCWALLRDKSDELTPRTFARYVPWMMAWPPLVFSYVGVLALAVLASLLKTVQSRPLRHAEYLCLAGFLLLGLRLDQVTDVLPMNSISYFVVPLTQPIGVAAMIIGTCLSPCAENE